MKQNQASRRINQIAREKIANILLFKISDPDLALVTVTGAEVSIDKSVMKVYISCEKGRYDSVRNALQRAKGRIRSLLGASLDWRVTPELIFVIDETTDTAEALAIALENVPPTLSVEKDEFGYPIEKE